MFPKTPSHDDYPSPTPAHHKTVATGYGLGRQILQWSTLNGTICLYIKGFGVASRTMILLWEQGVASSNLAAPTIHKPLRDNDLR